MAEIVFKLEEGRLSMRWENQQDKRDLQDDDFKQFTQWAASYREIIDKHNTPKDLLQLGRDIYRELNGDLGWLDRLVKNTAPPLLLEFATSFRPDETEKSFLEVPWELLADADGHWALRSDLQFVPVRRLGKHKTPPASSPYRLNTVFMAAAPEEDHQRSLDYELEETAILDATGTIGMDLIVEESGTLDWLVETLSAEKPVDVLHISCHGSLKPQPSLILEDEYGLRKQTDTKELCSRLSGQTPRLLFLSACQTSASDRLIDSLSFSLIQHGAPAVLGWAGSVRDTEATHFAAGLYHQLSHSQSLCRAVALARLELLDRMQSEINTSARDWHLPRLYLGPTGGGVLSHGQRARRRDVKNIHKAFLDTKNRQVPVAGPREFVGRRCQIQTILRTFRANETKGAYIHGLGRQGKSSLAARITQRMPHHDPVVLHGRFIEAMLLEALGATRGDTVLQERIRSGLQDIAEHPENLTPLLQELLEHQFNDWVEGADGPKRQPILLVIDDFEQCLQENPPGPHRIEANLVPTIRAILLAFRQADTHSRLLFTSRYTFSLTHGHDNLADDLLDVQLPPMEEYESRKQAGAKTRTQQTKKKGADAGIDPARIRRIIQAAQGSPGLQDLLFSLALENGEDCDHALDELEQFIETGQYPNTEELLKFLTNLAVQHLIDLLSPGGRELLRIATVFTVPIPLEVFIPACRAAGLGNAQKHIEHLLGLGLWDLHLDPVQPDRPATAVNPLVRPVCPTLTEKEQQAIVKTILSTLYQAWGGEDRKQRSYLADMELARLALMAPSPDILSTVAPDALAVYQRTFRYKEGAALGKQIIEALDREGSMPSSNLLRRAGELSETVGEVQTARTFFERALTVLKTGGESADSEDLAAALLAQGRRLVKEGKPDEAEALFRQAQEALTGNEFLRERAICLGDIARIQVAKGQVEEAMKLHQERLGIFEQLGDLSEKAQTLWSMSQIEIKQQQWKMAFEHLAESYQINQTLGRLDGICWVGLDLGQMLCAAGQQEEGLKILQRSLDGFKTLGQEQYVQHVQAIIDQIKKQNGDGTPPEPSS